MKPFAVTDEDLKSFHTIDRELFAILVMNLWRDPMEALQIIALWLWMERSGFRYVVKKILSLPNMLINEVADEAVICLNCISNENLAILTETNDIVMTQSLMDKEISLRFIYENRQSATRGVAKIVKEVCIRSLSDIVQKAIQRNAAQSVANNQRMLATLQPPVLAPTVDQLIMQMQSTVLETDAVPPENRTMFVTFSKGYPVSEKEVWDFFTLNFGGGIESVHMQEVSQGEQSLFARIVFQSSSAIDIILKGQAKAKFTINGKHVWVRKFVPKRSKFLSNFPYVSA